MALKDPIPAATIRRGRRYLFLFSALGMATGIVLLIIGASGGRAVTGVALLLMFANIWPYGPVIQRQSEQGLKTRRWAFISLALCLAAIALGAGVALVTDRV